MKFSAIRSLFAFAAITLLPVTGQAANVYINSPLTTPGSGAGVAGFKLRASPTNWDMSLSNQGGTPSAANFLSANLANNFSSGVTFRFSIEHRPGEGFVFTARRTQGSGTTTATLAWGTFSPPVIATASAASLNGISPGASYNTLQFDTQTILAGSSGRVKDLVFTAPGLAVTGAFSDSNLAANGPNSNGQYLVADTDLSSVAWTLEGEVTLRRGNGGGGGGDEQVRFNITARSGGLTPVPVPEAGTALLLTAALSGFVLRHKRS
jgi:hypothetical protein